MPVRKPLQTQPADQASIIEWGAGHIGWHVAVEIGIRLLRPQHLRDPEPLPTQQGGAYRSVGCPEAPTHPFERMAARAVERHDTQQASDESVGDPPQWKSKAPHDIEKDCRQQSDGPKEQPPHEGHFQEHDDANRDREERQHQGAKAPRKSLDQTEHGATSGLKRVRDVWRAAGAARAAAM